MSQSDIRVQRQREQDERRQSLQKNNAYFSVISTQPATITNAVNERSLNLNPAAALLPTKKERVRSSSPSLPLNDHPQQRKVSTTTSLNIPEIPLCLPTVTSTVTSLTTATAVTTTSGTVATAHPISSTVAVALTGSMLATYVNKQNKTAALPQPNAKKNVGSALQTGMDRYITIKRKLSPQNIKTRNTPKITRDNNNSTSSEVPTNTNRFELLAENTENLSSEPTEIKKEAKVPTNFYPQEELKRPSESTG